MHVGGGPRLPDTGTSRDLARAWERGSVQTRETRITLRLDRPRHTLRDRRCLVPLLSTSNVHTTYPYLTSPSFRPPFLPQETRRDPNSRVAVIIAEVVSK